MQQVLIKSDKERPKSSTPKFDAELERRKKELQEWKMEE